MTVLGCASLLMVLLLTAWAARKGSTLARGLFLGMLAGLAATIVLSFALGFLRNILPVDQIDFWLAAQLGRI